MQAGDSASRFGCLALASLLAAVLFALGVPSATAQPSALTPVTDAMLQDPAPEDWLMWRRTLNGWGYSPLDQIDRENVGALRMVWTRGLGPGLQQGTPLVHEACCTCRTRRTSSRRSMRPAATSAGSTAATGPTTSTST